MCTWIATRVQCQPALNMLPALGYHPCPCPCHHLCPCSCHHPYQHHDLSKGSLYHHRTCPPHHCRLPRPLIPTSLSLTAPPPLQHTYVTFFSWNFVYILLPGQSENLWSEVQLTSSPSSENAFCQVVHLLDAHKTTCCWMVRAKCVMDREGVFPACWNCINLCKIKWACDHVVSTYRVSPKSSW